MIMVKKKKGESDDSVVRRFKKKVLESGIIQEAKDRKRFKSKAEERKEKKARKKHLIELEKKRNY